METTLILAIVAGIAILLVLILKLKINAFLALLIASIATGIFAGLNPNAIIDTVKEGMGSTLSSVATIVGLGAMFGAILETSGGAKAIANFLIGKFGLKNAPLAMVIAGFLIAIPVFFDVAFIILVPMIYALQRQSGKSLLLYAIPLLAGLAITHAFIPPTPGPIAVADIIGAELGWVILIGFLVGIPTAICSGLLFGKYIAKRIFVAAPDQMQEQTNEKLPNIYLILTIIGIPIVLILLRTTLTSGILGTLDERINQVILLIGHPFSALIIANLLAWYFLGIRLGYTKKELFTITQKSLMPAGTIILLTGAGGVFKQTLINTGAGEMLASSLNNLGFPILLFAFIAAAIVRIIQGSSTVSMITAAGLVSPLLASVAYSPVQMACLVIAIASGASIFSHVNDSGFWLVGQYLGITEKESFKSWTMMTTILAITGMITVSILFIIL